MKQLAIYMTLLIWLILAGTAAAARPAKLSFTTVIGGQSIRIEATGKTNYTTCRYFDEDWSYLGGYDAALTAPDLAQFCVDRFEDRS